MMFQLVPSLESDIISFGSFSSHDAMPSMVCEEEVVIVNTGIGLVTLAFFMAYTLPIQVEASGNVIVEAELPVKISVLSVAVAVVEELNER